MTLEQVQQLRPGDQVTWTDPDGELCSRIEQKILSLTCPAWEEDSDPEDDAIVTITFEDGGEVECWASELS